jgi:hypothetical protein
MIHWIREIGSISCLKKSKRRNPLFLYLNESLINMKLILSYIIVTYIIIIISININKMIDNR